MRERLRVTTPEIEVRRQMLVGAGNDPVMASSPIGIMLARGLADDDTGRAAGWFAASARIVLGRTTSRHVLDASPVGEEISEIALRWGTTKYVFAVSDLSRDERSALIDVLHFQRPPRWLIRQIAGERLRPVDVAERRTLMAALAKLTVAWSAWTRHGLPLSAAAE